MKNYLSSTSLKSQAKGQLLGKYGTLAGTYAIHALCVSALSGICHRIYHLFCCFFPDQHFQWPVLLWGNLYLPENILRTAACPQ